MFVYIQIYIHVSGGHNVGTFYARKFKFALLFTQTKQLQFYARIAPGSRWGGARAQNV